MSTFSWSWVRAVLCRVHSVISKHSGLDKGCWVSFAHFLSRLGHRMTLAAVGQRLDGEAQSEWPWATGSLTVSTGSVVVCKSSVAVDVVLVHRRDKKRLVAC